MIKMVNKILVPIDGSEEADVALRKALEIAKDENAKVTIMHVIERRPIPMVPYPYAAYPYARARIMGRSGYGIPSGYPIWANRFDEQLDEHTVEMFKEVKEKIEEIAPDIEKDILIQPGKPSETILDVAKENDYDLIVMGATGLGDIGRFLLGSVSSRVKKNSEIPVRIFTSDGEEIEDVDQGVFS